MITTILWLVLIPIFFDGMLLGQGIFKWEGSAQAKSPVDSFHRMFFPSRLRHHGELLVKVPWQKAASGGIYQTTLYKHLLVNPLKNIDHPWLTGVQFSFNWATLEPKERQFQWENIDNLIKPWSAVGKKIVFMVKTVQKMGINPNARSATPEWVFDAGAQYIKYKYVTYPIYWDRVYLNKWHHFIRALAKKYDGHPNIAFIIAGVGLFGTTKLAGDGELWRRYESYGYTPQLWTTTIKQILDMYHKAFRNTPIVVALSSFQHDGKNDDSASWVENIARYAGSRGIFLYHHGLSATEKFIKKPYAALFSQLSKITRTGLGVDDPTLGSGRRDFGKIGDIVKFAVGGIPEQPYKTHISFATFYPPDCSASNPKNTEALPEYVKAFKWLHHQLRRESQTGAPPKE